MFTPVKLAINTQTVDRSLIALTAVTRAHVFWFEIVCGLSLELREHCRNVLEPGLIGVKLASGFEQGLIRIG